MKVFLFLVSFLTVSLCILNTTAQDKTKWKLTSVGGIEWNVKANDSHMDHIEMSGFYMSAIVHYGVQDGKLKQKVYLVFPMLRTIPNDTHASLAHETEYDDLNSIKVNGIPVIEEPNQFLSEEY